MGALYGRGSATDPRLASGHAGQAFLDLQSAMYQHQNANGLANSALWTLAVLVAMAAVSAVAMLRARPRRERRRRAIPWTREDVASGDLAPKVSTGAR